MTCAPSEDSDQPGHPPSLIRVLAVRIKKVWVLSYPLVAQRRLWSDWADAQTDLRLWWAHMPFCWFCREAAHFMNEFQYVHYCKSLYFRVFFTSRFYDSKHFGGNLISRCMMFPYVNPIYPNILRECWIRECSDLWIFATEIKSSQKAVNLQYLVFVSSCNGIAVLWTSYIYLENAGKIVCRLRWGLAVCFGGN